LRKIDDSGMRREGRYGVAMPSVRLKKGQISGDERLRKMKRRFAVIGRGGIVNVRRRNSSMIALDLRMKTGGNDARNELNVRVQDELPRRSQVLQRAL
jgi:hypothetical protein